MKGRRNVSKRDVATNIAEIRQKQAYDKMFENTQVMWWATLYDERLCNWSVDDIYLWCQDLAEYADLYDKPRAEFADAMKELDDFMGFNLHEYVMHLKTSDLLKIYGKMDKTDCILANLIVGQMRNGLEKVLFLSLMVFKDKWGRDKYELLSLLFRYWEVTYECYCRGLTSTKVADILEGDGCRIIRDNSNF